MKNKYDIVLISAKQGGGKSTTADALMREARRLKYSYYRVFKFADALYEMHDMLLNKMQEITGKTRVEKDGLLLQILGTEWGRRLFGENVWVDIVRRKINNLIDSCEQEFEKSKVLFVIDDCRFKNEFEKFSDAIRVRLEADEEIRKARTISWRENTGHQSETDLDDYAKNGMFDLYIRTDDDVSSPEHCATLIIAQLQKGIKRHENA